MLEGRVCIEWLGVSKLLEILSVVMCLLRDKLVRIALKLSLTLVTYRLRLWDRVLSLMNLWLESMVCMEHSLFHWSAILGNRSTLMLLLKLETWCSVERRLLREALVNMGTSILRRPILVVVGSIKLVAYIGPCSLLTLCGNVLEQLLEWVLSDLRALDVALRCAKVVGLRHLSWLIRIFCTVDRVLSEVRSCEAGLFARWTFVIVVVHSVDYNV